VSLVFGAWAIPPAELADVDTETMSKYGAVPTEVDGIRFASKAEARRYGELKLLLAGGAIADLEVHPKAYQLVVNGVKIGRYTADFRYFDRERNRVTVEDVKGSPSRDYRLRKLLVRALFDVEIVEIPA